MGKYKKDERQSKLLETLSTNPFLTDEKLAQQFDVSIQTIRLDRLELNIPELRERIKTVAQEEKEKVRSLSLQEVTGEIVELEMNVRAVSRFSVEESHTFLKYNIARGQYLFAQANSLCVAVIDYPVVLTKSAAIDFIKQVKVNDIVFSNATVQSIDNHVAKIEVISKVEDETVFKGKFEMYFKNEDEDNDKNSD